jgi:fermentation-respiration switch protein FrsA (DUF1100 family)
MERITMTSTDPKAVHREDVEFVVEGDVTLTAWLYLPEGDGPHPAITMAHGFAATREHSLTPFAELFVQHGFAVLVHDHRGFGLSGGTVRNDIDPWQQIRDWRRAITYLEQRPEVDAERIGLWGSSYSGGHALVLGATDRRLKCIVSQVPAISGYDNGRRRVPPDAIPAQEARFTDDERAQARGEAPRVIAVASADPAMPAMYRSASALGFYLQDAPKRLGWANEVTVRSNRAARMYEPGIWAPRVSPTPLRMIVATHDEITGTDLALDAYENARQPKSVVLIPGGHFDAYQPSFAAASAAAVEWFDANL